MRETKAKKQAWVLFAKTPEPGKVKTRLAQTMGDDFALAFYRFILNLQSKAIARLPLKKNDSIIVYYAGNERNGLHELRSIFSQSGKNIGFIEQVPGNLGDKMERCFREQFLHHERVIIWGSDAVVLSAEIFAQAAASKASCFISPCSDGGYGLIALDRQAYELGFMQNIAWSTRQTLHDQMTNLKSLKISYELGAVLPDLDTAADMLRVINYYTVNEISEERNLMLREWHDFLHEHLAQA